MNENPDVQAELLPVISRLLSTGEEACQLIRIEATVWRLLRHLAEHGLLHPALDQELIDEALSLGQSIADRWETDAILAASIVDQGGR